MRTIASTFILLIGSLYLVYGQGEPFNLDQYKKFLDENKNMDAVDLVTMYPSGFFQESVPAFRLEDVSYFDSLDLYFDFTGEEKQLLMKNGFVVTERDEWNMNIFNHFVQLYNEDLPVIITTDAILHAFHESYDDILQEVEEVYIIDHLSELLGKLHAGIGDLNLRYGEDQTIIKSLQDVDLYLSVPLDLLGVEYTSYYDINNLRVSEMIESIHAEQSARIKLFSDDCERDVDFSQFTPRGHYTESDELERYFRTMIWLGRTEIYLIEPSAPLCQTEEQSLRTIQRQVIMAYLIHELFEDEANLELYSDIENIISTFVGDQDNVKLPELGELFQEAGINSAFDLVDQGASASSKIYTASPSVFSPKSA